MKATKIAYNACYGGFGLSHVAIMRYAELKGLTLYAFAPVKDKQGQYVRPEKYRRIDDTEAEATSVVHYCTSPVFSEGNYFDPYTLKNNRTDPDLIKVVEDLGDKANGEFAKIRLFEVSPGTQYRIDEYDGFESVVTQDTYEWSTAP